MSKQDKRTYYVSYMFMKYEGNGNGVGSMDYTTGEPFSRKHIEHVRQIALEGMNERGQWTVVVLNWQEYEELQD